MSNDPTIVIADDHPLFRTALRETIAKQESSRQVLEAGDIGALQLLLEHNVEVDLILLDLNIPGALGFSALIFLCASYPEIPVMMISAFDTPETVARAIHHGAAGFLSKGSDAATIAHAIGEVLAGNIYVPHGVTVGATINPNEAAVATRMATLTPQQFRVASMLGAGLLNKQIAFELNLTEATIKAHVTEILRKLGVHSRTQAVLAMSQLNAQPPSPV